MGLFFGKNVGIWPPFPRITLLYVTTCCLVIYFEEILSWCVLKLSHDQWLFCIITCKWTKFSSYWPNTNIRGHFWLKCLYLTQSALLYCVTSGCLAIDIWRHTKCILVYIFYYYTVKIVKLTYMYIVYQYLESFFCENVGISHLV